MAEKLDAGDMFPHVRLTLVGGGTLDLPEGLDGKYRVILFYRGHWWPYCRRQLVGFENEKAELDALGCKVVAASVDAPDKAKEVADEVSFSVGYGVTREIADGLGSWWEDRRGIIQPSEFVLDADGKVMTSSYSSGPLGRIDAADVVRLIKRFESLNK